jgi:hypothetical protein
MNAPDKHLVARMQPAITQQDRNLADDFAGWAKSLDAESAFTRRRVKPSLATMVETLRQWHDDMKDELEMNYLPLNLEDVAEKLESAHRWANEAREQAAVEGPDNSWIRRQDAAERIHHG